MPLACIYYETSLSHSHQGFGSGIVAALILTTNAKATGLISNVWLYVRSSHWINEIPVSHHYSVDGHNELEYGSYLSIFLLDEERFVLHTCIKLGQDIISSKILIY